MPKPRCARIAVGSFFTELLPRLKSLELAGDPQPVAAMFVGRLEHLPVRYSLCQDRYDAQDDHHHGRQ